MAELVEDPNDPWLGWSVEVVDDAGNHLYTAVISDLVRAGVVSLFGVSDSLEGSEA